ncbi:MAG TPA: NADP-dependent oxidoreductase [Verrucomicrobiae bacterium]|nr:NADP-dependent oxidoreductase [Verrucomicrobiae bacterium]
MRVICLEPSARAPGLVESSAPQPQPGEGELLIRVFAAGVTAAELEWYPTSHTRTGGARRGAVPGHEFSGVVAAVGRNVGSLELGREVYGMNDWFRDGALAEFCVAAFPDVAPKPSRLTHEEAASVPISALTAWQGLIDRAKLQPGERVLVHGGAGGVGCFAVQIARWLGARVIATASRANEAFLRELGAEQVIDYHETRFEEHAADLDVVFDTVGGDVLERSWSVLKPGGRMVTIASGAESGADTRTKGAFFIVEPNQKQLSLVADMLESGRLRSVVDTVVPFDRAAEAFTGRVRTRHRGKVVVSIADSK